MPTNDLKRQHVDSLPFDSLMLYEHGGNHRILLCRKIEMSLFASSQTSEELKLAHIGFCLVS